MQRGYEIYFPAINTLCNVIFMPIPLKATAQLRSNRSYLKGRIQ